MRQKSERWEPTQNPVDLVLIRSPVCGSTVQFTAQAVLPSASNNSLIHTIELVIVAGNTGA